MQEDVRKNIEAMIASEDAKMKSESRNMLNIAERLLDLAVQAVAAAEAIERGEKYQPGLGGFIASEAGHYIRAEAGMRQAAQTKRTIEYLLNQEEQP